jgi:two-component system invasion response regulator UvrY
VSEPLNVLVVDDHPIVRAGICTLIKRIARFQVCGEAFNVASAVAQIESFRPDLMVLDLILGGRDGLDMVKQLKDLNPDGKILVYSALDEKIYARRALESGASGYLTKQVEIQELRRALEAVADGECYVSETVKQAYLTNLIGGEKGRKGADLHHLSRRELQILHLLGMGNSSAEIAAELHLSIKTIGTFRERLKDKLNLTSGRDLEDYARNFSRNTAATATS